MIIVRGGILSAVVLAVVAVGAAEAQVVVQMGPRAQPSLLNQLIANGGAPFRFHLLGGRLSFRSSSNFAAFDRTQDAGGLKEVFQLHIEKGQPNLTYQRTAREELLTIKVSGSGDVSIARAPRGNSSLVPVEFQQTPNKQITLTIGSGDHRQVFRAADFWRLVIAYPDECRQQMFPLLALLRPDWKLAEMAAGVEQAMLDDARADTASERAHWAALVKQLGDEQFAKREAADRTLREGKTAALNYLRRLDFNRLDAEQQFRVHSIVDFLAGVHEDDSAEEAAGSVAGDPMVWLALLGRSDPATRRTAAAQLATLLHEPITVDPSADPDTQKAQREQLRARIEGK